MGGIPLTHCDPSTSFGRRRLSAVASGVCAIVAVKAAISVGRRYSLAWKFIRSRKKAGASELLLANYCELVD